MYKTFSICILLSLSTFVMANTDLLKPNYPLAYTAKLNDTSWSIASQFLTDPSQWMNLYQANPDIQNPDVIHPGDRVELHFLKGRPYIQVSTNTIASLSPRIRVEPLNEIVPTIPLHIIKPFLNNTRVIPLEEFEHTPYIIAQASEHVVSGTGDIIYVQGDFSKQDGLTDFAILRKNRPYIDPQTREILGYEAMDVGTAHLIQIGNPSTLLVTRANLEVMRGDHILSLLEAYDAVFRPHMNTEKIQGQIIDVIGGVTQIGQYQIVVINRGAREHLAVGDLLSVYQQGKTIRDPDQRRASQSSITLPGQHAGRMMIFRVFERVSYGLILEATMPIHLLDTVTTQLDSSADSDNI